MMSTKMMPGWLSTILARASKPSTAVMTSQPTFLSSVSAVRRIVFESSITMTFKALGCCSIKCSTVAFAKQIVRLPVNAARNP
ncbi:hypothetical protein D3C86_1663100 [compost metagenome]